MKKNIYALLVAAYSLTGWADVSVERVMARGDLQRAIAAQINGCHEHTRGGRESAAEHLSARASESLGGERHDMRSRDTAVPADGNLKLRGLLADLFAEPEHEAVSHVFYHIIGEVHGLTRNSLRGDSADIGAAFELSVKLIEHNNLSIHSFSSF